MEKNSLTKKLEHLLLKDIEDSGFGSDIDHEEDNETDSEEDGCFEAKRLVQLLPEEIWLKVFSHFSVYDLCDIGLTCKGFLRISRDPNLWTSLTLVGDAITETHTVETLIERCTQLLELRITSRDDISNIINSISYHCPFLRSLEIIYCQPLLFSDLSKLSTGCRKLEILNLEGTGCLNSDGDTHEMEGSTTCHCCGTLSFANLFPKFIDLTELNLFFAKNLHSQGLELIGKNCTKLEILNIDEVNYLSDQSVNRFIEIQGSGLKQLYIDGESLTDESFSKFHKLTSLELLSVSFSDTMGSEGLNSIAQLKNLEWLKLRRGAELGPQSFVEAFKSGYLGNLLHLDLSECSKLDDSGLKAIAYNCPKLEAISLNWCLEVTDVGMSCLVNNCKLLNTLNLCGVVNLLGEFLPSILRLLPDIKLIDLEQCPEIQLSVLQDLVRQDLDLTVTEYYGDKVYPGAQFTELLLDNPDISFICYDHENSGDECPTIT